jgi:hypothetical protein
MHLSPFSALIGWIPVGLYLFRRCPARIAILAVFLGGWAVLPGARYIPTTEAFPYWILGVCLPSNYFLTKAMVTGLTALAGILIFHSGDLRRFRPAVWDLPMAVWCCVPLLSAFTHWSTHREGLVGAVYQTISWGVPWLLGRIYFSDRDSLRLAAKACVVAGICYVPVCLFEICAGPQLYTFIYGYQPYRWVGAERYVGFRPIGLLEDGNQLGIWMAVATLLAVCLSARRLTARILGLPIRWVAGGLATTTLLCQSVGSILLLLLLLPLALLRRRSVLRTLVVALVLAIVTFALFRMTAPTFLRSLAQRNGAAHSISSVLTEIGRHSLAWRLAREERDMAIAFQNPLLGLGRWNWWQNGDFRPWSLWLLVLGMYGWVGLVAFGLILFLPALCTNWPSAGESDPDDLNLRQALVAVILMVAFDNLLNGAMILPYLLVMGGLTTRRASLGASTRGSRTRNGPGRQL